MKLSSGYNVSPVFTRRFNLLLVGLSALVTLISLVFLWQTDTSVDLDSCLVPIVSAVFLFAIAFLYRHRDRSIFEIAMTIGWATVITNVSILPMFLIGRLRPPFQDDTLAALDRWIGIEVPDILALEARFPLSYHFVSSCYGLLLPLIVCSLVIAIVSGKGLRIREFLCGLFVTATIGFVLFYLYPAAGWFERYAIAPRPDQVVYIEMIANVWSQESFEIDMRYGAGLVYFPSFHTILPILCLFCLRAIPWALLFAVPLSILIVLSTMTTGSHYPCDIYAGVVVGILGGLIAIWCNKKLSRLGRQTTGQKTS